jgi:putative oxidoreductase
MQPFPFISLKHSLVLLRIFTAGIFIAHAAVRIGGGTITRFGDFLNNHGFTHGITWVWGITLFEIIGGTLLAIGFFTRWLSAGFIILLLVGIVIIHAANGWFVGEHGSGGSEYSAVLIVALLVIAAADQKQPSARHQPVFEPIKINEAA